MRILTRLMALAILGVLVSAVAGCGGGPGKLSGDQKAQIDAKYSSGGANGPAGGAAPGGVPTGNGPQ